jgi:two-component system sensor histidine kinase DesK
MLKKLYPAEQMEKYLLIDVIALLYLIFQVFSASAMPWLERVLFIVLYILFYYVCLWYRDWRLLITSLAGFLLLAILGLKIGTWVLLYGFVFAHLLGRAKRKAMIGAGIAGIAGMFVLYGWIHEGSGTVVFNSFYMPVMIGQMVTPFIVSMRMKAIDLKEKLDIANEQLARYIQEEERNRIARDLHDTLGQTLTMIKLKSELALRFIEKNPNKVKEELNDILNSSRYALKQVGELVSEMRYIPLSQEMEQSREVLQKAGIGIDLVTEQSLPALSSSAETMLALSVREAVTNIIKHSGASRCTIEQFVRDDDYYVQIRDNGNGHLQPGRGNGLRSMKERLNALQGEVMMTANPGKGTTVIFKVPLKTNRRVTLT